MQIIKDQNIVDDQWRHADETGELPSGSVTVPVARWQNEREALIARGDIGLRLQATDNLEAIADDLGHFGIIAIEFARFNDGRGFSQARLLRERYRYRNEIRAVGSFLRDQLYYMQRCGFNAFEFADERGLEDALHAFEAYDVISQPDVHVAEGTIGPWR
jgi:uncharacterized protein (DUF934 family)